MSQTQLLISPVDHAHTESTGGQKLCPFASNCSCIFQGADSSEPLVAEADRSSETIDAEIASWNLRGWSVVSEDAHEVVLERKRNMSFCLNVLLCLATGFLWVIYWVLRARHPKFDTKVLVIPEVDSAETGLDAADSNSAAESRSAAELINAAELTAEPAELTR